MLAEIDSPEVDQQLAQAKAQLATSQANLKLAEITMNRYQGLMKDAIPKQDVDNAVGAYEADKATVAVAGRPTSSIWSNWWRFEKVVAPFDGVITARNTDIGQLVNAGNGGAAQELFRISATDKLRIFVSVPQMYSQAAVAGRRRRYHVDPRRRAATTWAKLRGIQASIDPTTRTLLTEVDIDNSSGQADAGSVCRSSSEASGGHCGAGRARDGVDFSRRGISSRGGARWQ